MREYVNISTSTRIRESAANRLLAGKTIITAKTSPAALAHWGFAVCEPTERPGPDYRLRETADLGEDSIWRQAWEPVVVSQDQLKSLIEQSRKQQESIGVTVNGIRYSGDKSNRIALQEALTAASEYGLTEFASWKDSDDVFHSNVPVSDVHTALSQIGQRRMALIALEGQYFADVASGVITARQEVESLSWAI